MKGPLHALVVVRLGVTVLSVLALLSQNSELNCEENKHEVGLFDKQSPSPK